MLQQKNRVPPKVSTLPQHCLPSTSLSCLLDSGLDGWSSISVGTAIPLPMSLYELTHHDTTLDQSPLTAKGEEREELCIPHPLPLWTPGPLLCFSHVFSFSVSH